MLIFASCSDIPSILNRRKTESQEQPKFAVTTSEPQSYDRSSMTHAKLHPSRKYDFEISTARNFSARRTLVWRTKFLIQEQGGPYCLYFKSYFAEIEQLCSLWKTPSVVYKIANVNIQMRTFPQNFEGKSENPNYRSRP